MNETESTNSLSPEGEQRPRESELLPQQELENVRALNRLHNEIYAYFNFEKGERKSE